MHIMTWKADDTAPKTGPVTVVERFQKGKIASKRAQTELARSLPSGRDFFKIPEEKQETDGTGLCEDGIAESRDFFAVIDGSTSKGTLRMDGKSSGRMAMEVLRASIPCLPKDADAATAAACLTSAIRHYYEVHGVYEEAARHAENRMTASAVVYSVHRHEVWMIGDCLCRFNGMTYTNPKPTDCILAGIMSMSSSSRRMSVSASVSAA